MKRGEERIRGRGGGGERCVYEMEALKGSTGNNSKEDNERENGRLCRGKSTEKKG